MREGYPFVYAGGATFRLGEQVVLSCMRAGYPFVSTVEFAREARDKFPLAGMFWTLLVPSRIVHPFDLQSK